MVLVSVDVREKEKEREKEKKEKRVHLITPSLYFTPHAPSSKVPYHLQLCLQSVKVSYIMYYYPFFPMQFLCHAVHINSMIFLWTFPFYSCYCEVMVGISLCFTLTLTGLGKTEP